MLNPESTWFGTKPVTPDEKTAAVLGVFSSVAQNYDIMNDLMSLGVHRMWKDRFVRLALQGKMGPHIPMPLTLALSPHAGRGDSTALSSRPIKIIDVAGGTGDIAFRLHAKTHGTADITVSDINPDMLSVGQTRAIDRGIIDGLSWVPGNAEHLPFDDNTFDIYTIAFGLRNVTHIDAALADAYRLLKPGGRFCCLEFSRVQDKVLDAAYQIWSRYAIPNIGAWVAKDRDSYQYLVESIRAFPTQEMLARRLKQAGFDAVRVVNLTGGIAAIHVAEKY